MKKLFFSIFLIIGLVFPLICTATPAFIKSESFFMSSGSGTITYTGATAGSLLLIGIRTSELGTVTVSGSGMSWTRDGTKDTLGWQAELWSCPNVGAGDHVISISFTGTYCRVVAIEFSGMALTSPLLDVKVANGAGTVTSGIVTTSANDFILVALAGSDPDHVTWVAGDNYTLRSPCLYEGEPDQKICFESRGPVPAGSYSNGFNSSINGWVSILAAYAPAGTGPPLYFKGSSIKGGAISY